MTTFRDALRIIFENSVQGLNRIEKDITQTAGFILAEEIESDIDMPDFNRAMMDGYAFRRADVVEGGRLVIAGTIAAGDRAGYRLAPGECVRIMTGAPVPDSADTVIPFEQAFEEGEDREADGASVLFQSIPFLGQHISPKGEDLRRGQQVLPEGHLLGAQEIAILAAVGRRSVKIWAPPVVAYMGTGNELVEPGEPLPAGKIRNSNAYAIGAQIAGTGAVPQYLGIALDDEDDLQNKIGQGLESDFLLLSGGVSRGRYDLVPGILSHMGVEIYFRRLQVQPGHPTLFGMKDHTAVFGLPGNPIATFFAFELYVAPVLRHFQHHPKPDSICYHGVLTGAVSKKSGKTHLIPCVSEWRSGEFYITPMRTNGSADIFSIAGADAIGIIPPDAGSLEVGDRIPFCRLGHQ
ncbi:MAG: molybdopterin molybdotransferase MoeA [Candidatus Eisenbacteria bacterium]|uniref:Molybdopterin molybdenumtransferase n=1 Tax=Eiseniibacteriota bacterium TaxID=2212470 RepID=A0A948S1L4_UNCEI|nr:molybdopterin molybdotransferase MoeA [Candidatus Eisenbacteria bacterium]MBU1948174.1 molybdopterin molybdotransferase MoeA [Candidatus Eisenbacteria bacterium]MBU2693222.1 molybdopterin molybdotransferase MoeA [Candidatus Eisenbacteria bacterium]